MNRWLRRSAFLTILALALMVWSLLQPTPLPVMLAMSLGQAIGTAAFAIYGWIVLVDLRRLRRAARLGAQLEAEERAATSTATAAAEVASAATAAAAAAVAVAERGAPTPAKIEPTPATAATAAEPTPPAAAPADEATQPKDPP